MPNHSIMLVFALMGFGFGVTNIFINSLAHSLEETTQQRFARCHGNFSIGTLVSGVLAQPISLIIGLILLIIWFWYQLSRYLLVL